jgi:hypothetical protein
MRTTTRLSALLFLLLSSCAEPEPESEVAVCTPACGAHAACVEGSSGARCECDRGYVGDGTNCAPPAAIPTTTATPAVPAQAPVPDGRFVVREGVVADSSTGLEWERVVNERRYSQATATTYCSGLALDGGGFRLPSVAELLSIVDASRVDPALPQPAFAGSPVYGFWSSTPHTPKAGYGWFVSSGFGSSHFAVATFALRVRCVRGRPLPPASFVTARDTVTDRATGLVWQRAVDTQKRSQADAAAYCASLTLPGTGWRLPSVGELTTIVDYVPVGLAIDATAFPETPASDFWTSSPFADGSGAGWFVSFAVGYGHKKAPQEAQHVRCVRGASSR